MLLKNHIQIALAGMIALASTSPVVADPWVEEQCIVEWVDLPDNLCLRDIEFLEEVPVDMNQDSEQPPLATFGPVTVRLCNPASPTCVNLPLLGVAPSIGNPCLAYSAASFTGGGCTAGAVQRLYPVEQSDPPTTCLQTHAVSIYVQDGDSSPLIEDLTFYSLSNCDSI